MLNCCRRNRSYNDIVIKKCHILKVAIHVKVFTKTIFNKKRFNVKIGIIFLYFKVIRLMQMIIWVKVIISLMKNPPCHKQLAIVCFDTFLHTMWRNFRAFNAVAVIFFSQYLQNLSCQRTRQLISGSTVTTAF